MTSTETPWAQGITRPAMATLPARFALYMNDATYSTLILPVVIEQQQYAVVAYCLGSGRVQDQPQEVLPPFAVLYVSYPDKSVRWEEVTPEKYANYGLVNLATNAYEEQTLGYVDPYAPGVTTEALQHARRQYLHLISLVLEREWLLKPNPPTEEERTTARELQACVALLYKKFLLPYYQHVGHDFLAWMTRAAQ
jgi:hypothetical protein